MKKNNHVSQQRIAQELGVSQALVSLVLNGKRENISEDSYQRIWDHAMKVGYRPKGMKINLDPTLRATNVGFILRSGLHLHTQSNYFSHVQHGLHTALQQRGLNSVFLGSEGDLTDDALQSKLEQTQFFGIAVMGQVEARFLKTIKKFTHRVVSVSAAYPGICQSVMPNEAQALDQLVEHLQGLGHTHFAWLGGNLNLRQNAVRHAALVDSLQSRKLQLRDEDCVNVVDGDRKDGRSAAQTLLDRYKGRKTPTAWVCLNGLMARGAVNFLAANGLPAPDRLSVVAVDATRVCDEEHPRITGANADPEKMGVKAAELLLSTSGKTDESMTDLILPSILTARESSGPCPKD